MRHLKHREIFFHLPFALLAILAIIFHEERLYADAGYYISHVINQQSFHVEHGRMVLVFSQILPLMAVYCGVGLKTILVLYSLGHVLFFYFLFLILYYRLKNEAAGLSIILLQFAGISQGFFAPQFEMYYALGLLVLFIAIVQHGSLSNRTILLLVLLEILVLSGHPMCFPVFLLFLARLYMDKAFKTKKHFFIILGILLIGIIIKFLTFSEYEHSKVAYHLNFQLNKQYLQLFDLHYLKKLAIYLALHYIDVLFLVVLASMAYFQGRQLRRWLIMVVFTAGYILFMNAMYPAIEPGRYYEQVYFPFAAVVVILFAFDYFDKLEFKWIGILMVSALIVYRSLLILDASAPFQQRVLQMKAFIEHGREKDAQRVVFDEVRSRASYSNFGWSYPIESLLISSQDRHGMPVTLISREDYELTTGNDTLTGDEFIFRVHEIKPVGFLNSRYFDLGPGSYIFY